MSEQVSVEGVPSWHERLALVSPSLAGRSTRHLLAVGVLAMAALLAAGVVAWWLFRAPPPPVELSLPVATAAPALDGAGAGGDVPVPAGREVVVVQAAGAVARPGVYELPAGSRIADLLAVAGGPAADADADRLSLAARLVDGQRVYVPRHGEDLPPEPVVLSDGGEAGGGSPPAPIDLNTADAATLDDLPGVGPATAAAIVTHRERHGRFRTVDDLLDVPGIGPAKLAALRSRVRV